MKTNVKLAAARRAVILFPIALAACAASTPPPRDLVNARAEIGRAKEGPVAALAPTEIHDAEMALYRAETSFADDPSSAVTKDLAAVALLKVEAAEVIAGTAQASAAQLRAERELQGVEAEKLRAANAAAAAAQQGLANTQTDLAQTRGQLEQQRAETAAERQHRTQLEAQLASARDTLARIASVKDDERGLVMTFQGESLFATGKWDLLPAAMAKLDQVAETLRGQERTIDVVGYADNQGGVGAYNQDLSEKRASAVKTYLVAKGIPADLVRSEGRGASQFVADNATVEGRAANRRVEIIVEPKKPPSAPAAP